MTRWPQLVLPLLLVAAGCGSVLPARKPAAERVDEVAALKERVRELQRQERMNEVEIARLRRQVAELGQRLEEDSRARAAAPPRASVEPTSSAEASIELGPPLLEERPAEEDLEMPPPRTPPADSPEEPPPTAAADSAPLTADGQALYDRGYTLYHQAAYVDSESVFQTFLQRHSGTDLADNAQFWIGESRLRRGDLNGALAAFRETVDRFPRGNKVPDAWFRTGDCLEKLGDLDGARAAWRATIERFPSSAAAALSEERLDAVP